MRPYSLWCRPSLRPSFPLVPLVAATFIIRNRSSFRANRGPTEGRAEGGAEAAREGARSTRRIRLTRRTRPPCIKLLARARPHP